ncbi:MAG: type I DNA topoisomerase [Bacteroidales bacterium]|nr:type I DNA topoisomerase [Bacteroidales bacterium]
MSKNLVIVESPAKAKTIEGFLGKDFVVKSSFGHIRDLSKKNISVDIQNDFKPEYEIPEDKKKIIAELKKLSSEAEIVWLASDEDREGEAISWHLYEALGLDANKTRRIVFHEITKTAIANAIENPRSIDLNLVNAQQARRVLDRLVGYELSPLLWKKIKPSLSAGRVQSVAVRLIVEREEEIRNFTATSSFRVIAKFEIDNKYGKAELLAELSKRFNSKEETIAFLEKVVPAVYTILEVEKKPAKKSPAPPFTTSTLQQEAARKLGFPVAKTMMVAQQLYEEGKITYMRTDSVNLSDLALHLAKEEITNQYGKEYVHIRKYTTRTKGAQEAHEAIRPAYMNLSTAGHDDSQRRLYDLIWKRTIASQMADAQLERTTIDIGISTTKTEKFLAKGEIIRFDGFLKVYSESSDDEFQEDETNALPPVEAGEVLGMDEITATQRFTQSPARYTEASLVKKMEELGIGRPSTYAPTISTVQKREYVTKGDRDGIIRHYTQLTLKKNNIVENAKSEKTGFEKSKLFPTDIGSLVNNYLVNNFGKILDYHFTANVEKEFDEIAEGNREWSGMLKEFYGPFHTTVTTALESTEKVKGERHLGIDPKTEREVYVKIGRFGPIVQLGETESADGEKPRFAGLRKNQSIETITLEESLELLKLPRLVGTYQNLDIIAAVGRFGPYLMHNKKFISLPKGEDPLTVETDRAIQIIEEKKIKDAARTLKTFDKDTDLKILNGRYGPYIAMGKKNIPLPKNADVEKLSLADCKTIAEAYLKTKENSPKKSAKTSTAAPKKKSPAKKPGSKSSASKKTKK